MPDAPAISVADLARRLGGVVEGDPARILSDVATLDAAGPEAVSWVGSPEFLPKVSRSRAGAVLVPTNCSVKPGPTLIRVADPGVALCEALKILAPPPERVAPGVHPTATVDPTAIVEGAAIGAHVHIEAGVVIGAGTQLFPGVFVGSKTAIGRDCVVWPNVVIRERVTIENRVVIHPNATIGADGFGYIQREGKSLKIPQIGTVVIEDDVEIGANTAIDRARSGVTRVGRGTKIDNHVQIAHNVVIGEHCVIVAHSAIGGSATLGNHVVAGGQSGIGDHCRMENNVQIAAKSIILHNVPEGKTIRGIPAVDHHQFLRQQASLRKIPKWIVRIRELTRRVDRLENKEGDPADSR